MAGTPTKAGDGSGVHVGGADVDVREDPNNPKHPQNWQVAQDWQVAPSTPSNVDPQGRKWTVADDSQDAFTIDDLKSLDLETKTLPQINQLVAQLFRTLKPDGIWDNQKLIAVPLLGRQDANLTTQVGLWSEGMPKDHQTLLFSVEIAYFIAQIVHELASRNVFTAELQAGYAVEPEQLLADWVEENEANFTLRVVEQKKHWERITNALLDAGKALRTALTEAAETAEEAEATAETTAEQAAQTDDDDEAYALNGDAQAEAATEGGEGSPDAATEPAVARPRRHKIPLTAPEDVMRSFLLGGGGDPAKKSNEQFLRELTGLGFSARDRRLIVDQTAWIYSGVLAQVFPGSIGKFEDLDPVARAQINQLVRDYIMRLPNRQQVLANLIANPLGRSELITDICKKHSSQLSVWTQQNEQHLKNAFELTSRESIIAQQLDDLEKYLITQAASQGLVLSPETARLQAYNALSKLDDGSLRSLDAGNVKVRHKVYESAAGTTAAAVLATALARGTNGSLENVDITNITNSLNAVVVSLLGKGLTQSQVQEHFTSLPAAELLLLLGIDKSNPLYAIILTHIKEIRDAAQFYVSAKVLSLQIVSTTTFAADGATSDDSRKESPVLRALNTPPVFTSGEVNNAGGPEEIAKSQQSTTTERGKAFFKHYLERWNMLTVDEQTVVYLLTDARVPQTYLRREAPVELLPPTMGFIDLESEVKKDYFQALVRQFTLDRGSYKSQKKRNELKANFTEKKADVVTYTADSDNRVQVARAFEEKYKTLWSRLSDHEKMAVYLAAGVPFVAGNKLELIAPFVDIDIGSPEFQKLVAVVANNPQIVSDTSQQEQFTEFFAQLPDTSTSEWIVAAQQADAEALAYAMSALSEVEQQRVAAEYGYQSAKELLAAQQARVYELGGGGVSPDEVAFYHPSVTGKLNAYRHALATNSPLPRIGSAGKKFTREGFKQSLKAMDKSIGMALAAVPGVGTALSAVWNNRYTKALFAVPIGLYLKALGSWGGAGGALIGGTLGTLAIPWAGPAAPFIGSFGGALLGEHLFGGSNWFGARVPPSPFAEPSVASVYPKATGTEAGAEAAAAETAAVAKPAVAATAVAATAAAIWSVAAWPIYAVGGAGVMTIMVFTIIWGAFLAPSPTRPLLTAPETDGQASAKYISVEKVASPNQLENPGTTSPITYTLTIAPQPGFKLQINEVTDEYTSFGKKTVPTPPAFPSDDFTEKLQAFIASQPAPAEGQTETLLTSTFVYTYTIPSAVGEDAFLVNTATLGFDVYNYLSESAVARSQVYAAAATVTIGKPEIGCWPVSGSISTRPFKDWPTHLTTDSFDIAGNAGQPIYAPFPGTACRATGWNDGYGNMIKLYVDGAIIGQTNQLLAFYFGHLNRFSPQLNADGASCLSGGIAVVPGTVLGYVGSTGNSTGAHLHFELYSNRDGLLNGGRYVSTLSKLMPNAQNLLVGDKVTTCF